MENSKISDDLRTPPVGSGKSVKEKKEKGVSKTEFSEFKEEVSTALGAIMEKLSTPAVIPSAPEVKDEAGPQTPSLVPPAWRALTDEILGPEFEIELELPENGGQKFSVYVPLDKSNAHPDYKKTFKKDKRTKELGNTGIKGVKDWVLKIRKNLVKSGIKLPYYEDTQPQLMSTR